MTIRNQIRHQKITGKPRAGSKWNLAEIEPIVMEVRANIQARNKITVKDVADKHGIGHQQLLRKITDYNNGELK